MGNGGKKNLSATRIPTMNEVEAKNRSRMQEKIKIKVIKRI